MVFHSHVPLFQKTARGHSELSSLFLCSCSYLRERCFLGYLAYGFWVHLDNGRYRWKTWARGKPGLIFPSLCFLECLQMLPQHPPPWSQLPWAVSTVAGGPGSWALKTPPVPIDFQFQGLWPLLKTPVSVFSHHPLFDSSQFPGLNSFSLKSLE